MELYAGLTIVLRPPEAHSGLDSHSLRAAYLELRLKQRVLRSENGTGTW